VQGPVAHHRNRRRWPFAAVGAIVAVAVVVGIGPPGLLLPRATVCKMGTEIGEYTIWTPLMLINIPDGGNVTFHTNEWNITVSSGSLELNSLQPQRGPIYSGGGGGSGLNRAGIWAEYGDFNWTIFRTANTSEVGTSSIPCTQPFVAQLTVPGGGCGGEAVIPLSDNSTDAVEPHVWNGTSTFNGSETYPGCPQQTPGTYVWFDSSLNLGGTGPDTPVTWNLCGGAGYEPLSFPGIARVALVLHAPYGDGGVSVAAMLQWTDSPALPVYTGTTVGYLVPAGWNWTLTPVGPTNSPINPDQELPSLVAFERSAC
jgi:hypothetical protein